MRNGDNRNIGFIVGVADDTLPMFLHRGYERCHAGTDWEGRGMREE